MSHVVTIEGTKETPVEEVASVGFLRKVLPQHVVEASGGHEAKGLRYITPSSLFFQALHTAYAQHHAFGLRPEVLFALIASTVAEAVKQAPEEHRDLFTRSPDKELLTVVHNQLVAGNPDSPWDEAIQLFDAELRERIPSEIADLLLPDFSTHTTATRCASIIALMDAASPYYDYRVRTLCGIPRVVIHGEPEDYAKLHDSAASLSHYFPELTVYFGALLPVLKKLRDEVKAISEGGQGDTKFWGQIYKHFQGSGGASYGGWISSFVGYVMVEGEPKLRQCGPWNPNAWRGPIKSGSEMTGVSTVPFEWDYLGRSIPMTFTGGIMEVDVVEGALTPKLSWAVLREA